jgi:hypothetical protein
MTTVVETILSILSFFSVDSSMGSSSGGAMIMPCIQMGTYGIRFYFYFW